MQSPRVIIGLGNPGQAYKFTRHNIGFLVLDALSNEYSGDWRVKNNLEQAQISINNKPVLLIKPQTYMNSSGAVLPYLQKQGISAQDILVVHDELELPFEKIVLKTGGSAKGHNGLKSIISYIGDNFARLRVGISRPERREDVPNYVLQNFKESQDKVNDVINQAINIIKDLYK